MNMSAAVPNHRNVLPEPNDVLCGRGRVCFEHEGNRKFRALIALNLQTYLDAPSRKIRTQLVRAIAETVQSVGGRFLIHDFKSNTWTDGGMKKAKDKIGHSFRDAMAHKYKVVQELHSQFSQQQSQGSLVALKASIDEELTKPRNQITPIVCKDVFSQSEPNVVDEAETQSRLRTPTPEPGYETQSRLRTPTPEPGYETQSRLRTTTPEPEYANDSRLRTTTPEPGYENQSCPRTTTPEPEDENELKQSSQCTILEPEMDLNNDATNMSELMIDALHDCLDLGLGDSEKICCPDLSDDSVLLSDVLRCQDFQDVVGMDSTDGSGGDKIGHAKKVSDDSILLSDVLRHIARPSTKRADSEPDLHSSTSRSCAASVASHPHALSQSSSWSEGLDHSGVKRRGMLDKESSIDSTTSRDSFAGLIDSWAATLGGGIADDDTLGDFDDVVSLLA